MNQRRCSTLGLAILLSIAAGLLCASIATAQITGSAHDFSGKGWAQSQTCLPCHTPHGGGGASISGYEAGRLWNHNLPALGQIYTTYDGNFSRDEAMDSYSILCMGCHDGTVALDSFGGAAGTNFLTGAALVGTDLTSQHPVGISATWPDSEPSSLNPRATWEDKTFGNSRMGTLRLMVVNGVEHSVVSCATCHEPHGRGGHDSILRIDNTASQMCLTCHNK